MAELVEECSICGDFVSMDALEAHVRLCLAAQEPGERAPESVVALVDDDDGDDDDDGGGGKCPKCGALVALADVESHALAHALEDEERDELARREHARLRARYGFEPPGVSPPPPPAAAAAAAASAGREATPSQGAADPLERLGPLEPPGPNAVALLARALRLQHQQQVQTPAARPLVYLSGPARHFSTRRGGGVASAGDAGWGCGYRNAQMIASHLLLPSSSRPPWLRQSLFGGSNGVPTVDGIARGVEMAWRAGFDPEGAAQLGGTLSGRTLWIGATEIAALLRHSGVPADIVDFCGECLCFCDFCARARRPFFSFSAIRFRLCLRPPSPPLPRHPSLTLCLCSDYARGHPSTTNLLCGSTTHSEREG
jgi:hypothetical protein